ncbi:Rv3235 family protein [Arthrobacter cryoconiti]|uniref:Rv3235 family protein n=1 Tax=Arthrobacter cryoconiti TaxID=748907 RepID=A0ABV8R1Z3_9MICC|nr:Rv3235 family protein [Arthrobacter cryoconiti]MCC9068446.1 Rv3235 family protein [Arthrobacter cryoconiti]
MTIMAVPETTSPPARLVRRPAPEPSATGTTNFEGTVVRMPTRPVAQLAQAAQEAAASIPHGSSAVSAGNGSSPVSLDTTTTERALVIEMTRKISLAVLEVLNGARSVAQLSRWLNPLCLSALATRARLHAQACQHRARHMSQAEAAGAITTLHPHPVVHSIHSFPVSPGIYETSVVVAERTRFRAMALRLEESHGVWKVTALRIG